MTIKEILEILREKLKKGESIPEDILSSITPEILKELPDDIRTYVIDAMKNGLPLLKNNLEKPQMLNNSTEKKAILSVLKNNNDGATMFQLGPNVERIIRGKGNIKFPSFPELKEIDGKTGIFSPGADLKGIEVPNIDLDGGKRLDGNDGANHRAR